MHYFSHAAFLFSETNKLAIIGTAALIGTSTLEPQWKEKDSVLNNQPPSLQPNSLAYHKQNAIAPVRTRISHNSTHSTLDSN